MTERHDEDMRQPVTRGELREELTLLEQELEQKLDDKLRLWAGALDDRIDRGERRLVAHMTAETTRQINAIWEATRAQIAVLDDKYTDLPARVSRLEMHVFGGSPARPRRRKLKG